jgi:hypothetical protein
MRTHFKNDVIMYGLLRCSEQIDDTVAVKFCFIDWRGENINRMQRANLGIHSGMRSIDLINYLWFFSSFFLLLFNSFFLLILGEVSALFRPYHADLQAADNSEVTLDIIMNKIRFASGTAVHVK